jgi:hypothetical protein
VAERRKLISKALFNSKKSHLQRHVGLGNVDSDKQDRESLIDNDVPTGRRCSRSGQSALTASQFCLLTFLHICVSSGLYLSKGTITSELPRFSLLRRKADCHTSLPTRSRQSGGTITSAVLPSTSSISDSQRTHHVQSWQYSKPFRLQSRVRTAIPAGLLEPQPSTPTV